MSDVSIRTPILEFVDSNGASHIREMHIEILRQRPGTPEHAIRARLSEAVSDGLLSRLGEGFYDVYAKEAILAVVWNCPNIVAQIRVEGKNIACNRNFPHCKCARAHDLR